jgi:hypothetical protein
MAIDFAAASSQYIDLGNNLDLTDNFSFSFWIIPDTLPGEFKIIDKNDSPNGDGYSIFYRSTSSPDQIRLQCGDGAVWNVINIYWDTPWAAGEEHCVVITRSGLNYNLYDNGVLNTNKTESSTSAANVGASAKNLSIAREWDGTDYTDGKIWDVRIYDNNVISAAEAQIIYESRGCDNITDGLGGRWLLDEQPDGTVATGANTVRDISGNAIHGTPTNNPTYSAQAVKYIKMRRTQQ